MVCASRAFIQYQFSFCLEGTHPPSAPPLHLLPRNLTHRFGPNKVMSRVASFELFERMFITKHHVAPVLFGVGLSEPQSATLVGFRRSRGFTLSECVQVSAVHDPLHCRVTHVGNLLLLSSLAITRLERRLFLLIFFSTVRSTLFESFLFRPAPAASSSEPESLYLDIQRVTNRRSNPVLRQIPAVVKPSFVQEKYCAAIFGRSARHAFLP